MATSNKRANNGRKGGSERLRQLLVLIAALDEAEATVTVDAIKSRLSVDDEEAEKLMNMLVEIAGDESLYVPVALSDDGDELVLVYDQGAKGRAVRLTRGETFALLTAMDQMGVPEDDPTRVTIQEAFAASGVDTWEVERTSSTLGIRFEAGVIESCVRALVDHRRLSFMYKGLRDAEACERHVDPVSIHQEDGSWYLDAYDLDRAAARMFRLDRMDRVADTGRAEPHPVGRDGHDGPKHLVHLTIDDPNLLLVFDWHETSRRNHADGSVTITTPYLGGDWLPRHVAACGSHVRCDDEQVAALARAYAAEQLKGAK